MKANKDLQSVIQEKDISFYGYKGSNPLTSKATGFLKFYVQHKTKSHQKYYQSYRDIYESKATITFLDNEAIRTLLMGFPLNSEIVLIRLRFSADWVYGFLGLVRRIFARQLKVVGFKKLESEKSKSRWLIVESRLPELTKNNTLVTPNTVKDIEQLISYLNTSHIKYVVLRNYEHLPKLHREHGDVDFLIEDADIEKVKEFLLKNPGQQGIGLHLVSTPKSKVDQVPYLPPKKAKKIIDDTIIGRCDSRIPNQLDAFQSYAYHCVYNKGIASGVPSDYEDLPTNTVLDNDYLENLKRLADAAGVKNVTYTMEGLDAYLHTVGWRPHMDTLAKLAEKNIWIKRHFFANTAKDDVFYTAIVLRKDDMEDALKENIISCINEYGFRVVFQKKLSGETKSLAENSLRGGVWTSSDETYSAQFLPSDFLVVTDLFTLHKNKKLFAHRVRLLKLKIRQLLKSQGHGSNIIHSTDNTEEAKEYIATIFPSHIGDINESVRDMKNRNLRSVVSFRDRFELFMFDYKDKKDTAKKKLKIKMINHIFKQSK